MHFYCFNLVSFGLKTLSNQTNRKRFFANRTRNNSTNPTNLKRLIPIEHDLTFIRKNLWLMKTQERGLGCIKYCYANLRAIQTNCSLYSCGVCFLHASEGVPMLCYFLIISKKYNYYSVRVAFMCSRIIWIHDHLYSTPSAIVLESKYAKHFEKKGHWKCHTTCSRLKTKK